MRRASITAALVAVCASVVAGVTASASVTQQPQFNPARAAATTTADRAARSGHSWADRCEGLVARFGEGG
jgi:hypothetical protein